MPPANIVARLATSKPNASNV